MILGLVIGNVWSTKKSGGLTGQIFLRIKILPDGGELIAADCVGAGNGDRVLIATGGAARVAAGHDCPIDAAVVGIVDEQSDRVTL